MKLETIYIFKDKCRAISRVTVLLVSHMLGPEKKASLIKEAYLGKWEHFTVILKRTVENFQELLRLNVLHYPKFICFS